MFDRHVLAAVVLLSSCCSTAFAAEPYVSFPNPCYDLPASRTADADLQSHDDGWELIRFHTTVDPRDAADTSEWHHNDDYSDLEDLSFIFNFFGTQYNQVFVNNNGNLSFDGPYSHYDPEGFPVQGFDMIAPFWGDVDTRGHHGHVWIKRDVSGVLAIAWDHVGYFHYQGDKRNTFQLVISDGANVNNSMGGVGNNVCFCYQQMEWTTGDASDGRHGFGGAPATVGVNQGNGRDFFQVGLFDHAGDDYQGPSTVSGVEWLNFRNFCFNAADASGNTPPIPAQFPEDNTLSLCTGERLKTQLLFLSPEADQTTTVTITDAPNDMEIITHDGTSEAKIELDWTPTVPGDYEIQLEATDSAGGVTVVPLTIQVDSCAFIGGDPHIKQWNQVRESFQGACDLVMARHETFHDGTGLELHVRTEMAESERQGRGEFSYVQAAALKIGDDILEMNNQDEIHFNGKLVTLDDLPLEFGTDEKKYTLEYPFPAKKRNGVYDRKGVDMTKYNGVRVYRVSLHNSPSHIDFKTYSKFMSVTLHGKDDAFAHAVGLVGEYGTGRKLSRRGDEMTDTMDHGLEWQVRPPSEEQQDGEVTLFRTASPHGATEPCRMPVAPMGRKLIRSGASAELRQQAERVCAEHYPTDVDLCIDDILITGDLDMVHSW